MASMPSWCARGERIIRGVSNIGVRPTLQNASGERLFEVHLFDFGGDIYGEDLEVSFQEFIRPEQRFPASPRSGTKFPVMLCKRGIVCPHGPRRAN